MNAQNQILIDFKPECYQGLAILVREESNFGKNDSDSYANQFTDERGNVLGKINPDEINHLK